MLERINAIKLQWLALCLLVLYPLAILGARLEIWHFRNSFLIFILASLVGFALLVIAILKLSKASSENGNSRPLVITILATGLPLAAMASNILAVKNHPFIHDITTNFEQPPAFVAAKELRHESDHSVEYLTDNIELQKSGYPDLAPLIVNTDAKTTLHQAKVLMQKQGWEVLAWQDQQLPYTLEGSATSLLFGFVDDVALRFSTNTENPQQTVVDMRSQSRQGKSDLGQNAKRINGFFESLQQQ